MVQDGAVSICLYIITYSILHHGLAAPQIVYLDSYKTCNQLDYVIDKYRTYTITGERRPEVKSSVFMKCHITFKADTHEGKVCFTMVAFSPDQDCQMFISYYDGDSTTSGIGAVFDCNAKYIYPWKWCSSGQYAMVVLDRRGGRSTVRDTTVSILAEHALNTQRTVYLDSGCGNTQLLEHSIIYVHNRHINHTRTPPRRCDLIFDYIGEDEYPVCVTMNFDRNRLPKNDDTCPFKVTILEGQSTTGAEVIDEWRCDKTLPGEICSKGPLLTVELERLSYSSEQDPVGLFDLIVQDRSPAPPSPLPVTAIVLGTLGGLIFIVFLYLLLASYLDNKKAIYIGPCCLCRKYCKTYTDDSTFTSASFTPVHTREFSEVRL
ncbi:hypothetical protein SNE40_021305 [Patella caerulea]|uniref:Uncharacterized protein n=1 Tax=Patella caerulea TaxID=87958 RepID=A0AAN8FZ80_PATCE